MPATLKIALHPILVKAVLTHLNHCNCAQMSTSTDVYVGYGLCIDTEDLDTCPDDDLHAVVGSFDVEGFHAVLCGDFYEGFLTSILILSNDDNQGRDFTPVYDWLMDKFGGGFSDVTPKIVGGYRRTCVNSI